MALLEELKDENTYSVTVIKSRYIPPHVSFTDNLKIANTSITFNQPVNDTNVNIKARYC